ncbi:MAG: hypothetical protein K9W42_06545 [Candidatus Heimdallarchaeota archaeon]|nr:hypothetical protein [Candidatus Heimdallarchaeota archaeon]
MKINPKLFSRKQLKLKSDIEAIKGSKSKDSNTVNQIKSILDHYASYNLPEIVPVLLEVLNSSDYHEEIQLTAARVLSSYKSETEIIIPKIVDFLKSELPINVKRQLIKTLEEFDEKASPLIPELEVFIPELGRDLADTIDYLKNPVMDPFCPKCGKQSSFAFQVIPSTEQVKKAIKAFKRIPKSELLQHRKPFAIVVYCLNCGYIIGVTGGYVS